MSRKARISKKEKQELQRLNRNAQAKIRRLESNHGRGTVERFFPQIDVEPIKELREMSRAELNAYKEQISKFTRRGNVHYQLVKNEEGRTIGTKAEVQQVEREVRRINRIKEQNRKRRKAIQFLDRGKPVPKTTTHGMGLMGETRFKEYGLNFNPRKIRNRSEFEEWTRRIEETYGGDFIQRRNEQMKENYVTALDTVFGGRAKHIQEHVKNMSLDDFMEMWEQENLADIGYIYDRNELEERFVNISQIWGFDS